MYDGKKILGLIPARGGSKGLPGKNVADLGGKPLIAWSVAAAKASRHIDRVVLSSDDDAIIAAAEASGCEVPFRRPAELATDTASMVDVALHALDSLNEAFDALVLLQPTSPFRSAGDIDACIAKCCGEAGTDSVTTVTEPSKSPYWMYTLDAGGGMTPVLEPPEGANRRQALPTVYALNGAVYAVSVAWFRRERRFVGPDTRAQVMPAERSVDVDHPIDLTIARALCPALV